jgi:hypothetical protein
MGDFWSVMMRLLRLIVIRLAMTKRKKWFAMTPPFRHCESLSFSHCEFLFFSSLRVPFFLVIARSEATKQSLASVRHCEPKGWQMYWREAISTLHIPVGVRCSEGIASLTTFARNDGVGL